MDWTLQIGVALLNFLWIAYFLQPDPFSVAVWRRSSENSEEFCIQPSTAHSADTTSTPPSEITQQSVNITSTSSSHVKWPPSTKGVLDETMAANSPVLDPAASKIDTSSAATHVQVKRQSEHHSGKRANGQNICCFKFYPRRINKNFISSYIVTDHRCPKPAVILVTKKSREVCVDPSLTWVEDITKSVDEDSF